MVWTLTVLSLAFYIMGFGDMRGCLVGIAQDRFGITGAQAGLIPMFGAMAFGLGALPAGMLASRLGFLPVLRLGLALTALGHLLPWLRLGSFPELLASVFLVGAGMTLLLVTGNPLLRDLLEPARYARNLTLAQFLKALGSVSGPALIAAVSARGGSWRAVFLAFALVSLGALALTARFAPARAEAPRPATLRGSLGLLRLPAVRWRILGIFLFVGSEMGMNTWLSAHLWTTFGMDLRTEATRLGSGLFWLSQGAGRLLGALVLTWVREAPFLLGCSLAGLCGLAGLALGGRAVAVASVALCGATFANVWPTLFALLLAEQPGRAPEVAGLTVMANVGGALIPLGMGLVADLSGPRWSFLVPAAAFVYLVALALAAGTKGRREPQGS